MRLALKMKEQVELWLRKPRINEWQFWRLCNKSWWFCNLSYMVREYCIWSIGRFIVITSLGIGRSSWISLWRSSGYDIDTSGLLHRVYSISSGSCCVCASGCQTQAGWKLASVNLWRAIFSGVSRWVDSQGVSSTPPYIFNGSPRSEKIFMKSALSCKFFQWILGSQMKVLNVLFPTDSFIISIASS